MNPSSSATGRRRIAGGAVVAVAIAVAAILALTGSAASKSDTIGVARSGHVGASTEPIAVNARGAAVYDLVPETTRHFLCTSANGCFAFWAPVTVGSHGKVVKGAGVKGRLGTVRRGGMRQVTLNGHPLYTYIADGGRRGVATGDGIRTFGGVWHVFREGSAAPGAGTGSGGGSSTTASGTSTSSTSSPSPYPGY